MNYKELMDASDIHDVAIADVTVPSITRDLAQIVRARVDAARPNNAAFPRVSEFWSHLTLSSHPEASAFWYGSRHVRFLVWNGDLVVHGDLLDRDFEGSPILIVHGDLYVENWLLGGIPSIVGGSVRAKGFVIGHYNDCTLFVAGDLYAAGYLPCAKPRFDVPAITTHQISGEVHARKFDLLSASDVDMLTSFVEEVLEVDEESGEREQFIYLNEDAVFDRWRAGLPVRR